MIDVWNGLASFLAEMIEKYGNQIIIDTPAYEILYRNKTDTSNIYSYFVKYLGFPITRSPL